MSIVTLYPTGVFPNDIDAVQEAISDPSVEKILLKSTNQDNIPTTWNFGGDVFVTTSPSGKSLSEIASDPILSWHYFTCESTQYHLGITKDIEIVGDKNANGTPKTKINGGIFNVGFSKGTPWNYIITQNATIATFAENPPKFKMSNVELFNVPTSVIFANAPFDLLELINIKIHDIYPLMMDFFSAPYWSQWPQFPLHIMASNPGDEYFAGPLCAGYVRDMTLANPEEGIIPLAYAGKCEVFIEGCVFDCSLPTGRTRDMYGQSYMLGPVDPEDINAGLLYYADNRVAFGANFSIAHGNYDGCIDNNVFIAGEGATITFLQNDARVTRDEKVRSKKLVYKNNKFYTPNSNPSTYFKIVFPDNSEHIVPETISELQCTAFSTKQHQYGWTCPVIPIEVKNNTMYIRTENGIGILLERPDNLVIKKNTIQILNGKTCDIGILSTGAMEILDENGGIPWGSIHFNQEWPFEESLISNNTIAGGLGVNFAIKIERDTFGGTGTDFDSFSMEEAKFHMNDIITNSNFEDYEIETLACNNSKFIVVDNGRIPKIEDNGVENKFIGPGTRSSYDKIPHLKKKMLRKLMSKNIYNKEAEKTKLMEIYQFLKK